MKKLYRVSRDGVQFNLESIACTMVPETAEQEEFLNEVQSILGVLYRKGGLPYNLYHRALEIATCREMERDRICLGGLDG